MDLSAGDDCEAEVERLLTLGATRVGDYDEWGHAWTTLRDVEGNEFCVGGLGPSPTSSVDGRLAHLAPASVVTLAYVEGIEITALCGARFAPCRNPENFETCPACAEALALLRTGPSQRPTR